MKFLIFVLITVSSIIYFVYKSALIYKSTDSDTIDIVSKNKCVKTFDPITQGISATLIVEELNMLITRNWYGEILGYNLQTLKLEKNYSGPIHKFHRFASITKIPNKNQIIYDDFTYKKDNITLVVLDLDTGKNVTAFKTEMNSFSVQKIIVSPFNPELAVVLTGKTYDVYVYNITDGKLENYAWTLMNPMVQRYYQIYDMVYLQDGLYMSLNQIINKYDYDSKKYDKENEIVYFAIWNFSLPPNKNIVKKVAQTRAYQQIIPIPSDPNKFIARTYNKTQNTTIGGVFDYSTLEFTEFETNADYSNCEALPQNGKYIQLACSSGNVRVLQNLQVSVINVSEDFKNLNPQISLHTGDHYIVDLRATSDPNKFLVVVMTDNMYTKRGVDFNRMNILEWDIACQKKIGEVQIVPPNVEL